MFFYINLALNNELNYKDYYSVNKHKKLVVSPLQYLREY